MGYLYVQILYNILERQIQHITSIDDPYHLYDLDRDLSEVKSFVVLTLSRSVWTSATWSLVTMQFPRADSRSSTLWITTVSGKAFRRCCSSWSVVVLGTSSPRLFPGGAETLQRVEGAIVTMRSRSMSRHRTSHSCNGGMEHVMRGRRGCGVDGGTEGGIEGLGKGFRVYLDIFHHMYCWYNRTSCKHWHWCGPLSVHQ